jgi:hypothetical protein
MKFAEEIRYHAEDDQFASKFPTGMMLKLADAIDELERTARRFSDDPTPEHNKALTDAVTALVRDRDEPPYGEYDPQGRWQALREAYRKDK